MSQVMTFKPVEHALEIFAEISREVEKLKEEVGRKLRARSRDAPGLIEEIGLVPALSFFYSKIDDVDYRLMLLAILRYLRRINVITVDFSTESDVKDTKKMLQVLRELSDKSVVVTLLLRPFLVEFKRLCEATWEPLGD